MLGAGCCVFRRADFQSCSLPTNSPAGAYFPLESIPIAPVFRAGNPTGLPFSVLGRVVRALVCCRRGRLNLVYIFLNKNNVKARRKGAGLLSDARERWTSTDSSLRPSCGSLQRRMWLLPGFSSGTACSSSSPLFLPRLLLASLQSPCCAGPPHNTPPFLKASFLKLETNYRLCSASDT